MAMPSVMGLLREERKLACVAALPPSSYRSGTPAFHQVRPQLGVGTQVIPPAPRAALGCPSNEPKPRRTPRRAYAETWFKPC